MSKECKEGSNSEVLKHTGIPNFDRLVEGSGHNLAPIGRELDGGDAFAVGVGLLSHEIQGTCQRSEEASVLARERRFGDSGAPESQTLIVRSLDPETIKVPSWLKLTDVIQSLWAFCFSLFISSVAAARVARQRLARAQKREI